MHFLSPRQVVGLSVLCTVLVTWPALQRKLRCEQSQALQLHSLHSPECGTASYTEFNQAFWESLLPSWQPSQWRLWSGHLSESRALLDPWSMAHLWGGIWIGAILSPITHPWMGWIEAYAGEPLALSSWCPEPPHSPGIADLI